MNKIRRKSKTITISKKDYETLIRDQMAYKMLIQAIDQTRAEDQLVWILQRANIKS